jgi:hypothetical protein
MSRIWFGRGVSNHAELLSWVRSHEASKNWTLMVSHFDCFVPCFEEADEYWLEEKELYDDVYVEYALQSCITHRVDVFIPGRQFIALSKRKDEFEALGVKILLPASTEVLEKIEHKNHFYNEIKISPVPGPVFTEFSTVDELDACMEQMNHHFSRLCCKPAVGVFAAGFRVISENIDPFGSFFEPNPFHIEFSDLRFRLGHHAHFAKMLLMEFLEGHEYSIDCFRSQKGELVAVPRCKKHGGQLLSAPQELLDGVEWLAVHFDMKGLFNIQLKQHHGSSRTLEINPRMSGGIAMTRFAGFNFPVAAIAEALGETISLAKPVLGGKVLRREYYMLRQKDVVF